MPGVAELVNHDVTQMTGVKEHQAVIQADRACAGMAPPAGLLAANVHSPERVIRLHG